MSPVRWDGLARPEGSAPWLNDRERKLDRIRRQSLNLLGTFLVLKERAALSRPTTKVLLEVRESTEWYLALAGFSSKTLRNLTQRAKDFGLKVSPETFARNLIARPDAIASADLKVFTKWLSSEIEVALHGAAPADEEILARVAMIIGARIVGQVQNAGGQAAVGQVKLALLEHFPPPRLWSYEAKAGWIAVAEGDEKALDANRWRHEPSGAVFDFTLGGDRPDLMIFPAGSVSPSLVAEIKGRKDAANVWESWMPQLGGHLMTWKSQYLGAARGVLMTLVSTEMIEGRSRSGTLRQGLRSYEGEELLDFAFNIEGLLLEFNSEFKTFIEAAMKIRS